MFAFRLPQCWECAHVYENGSGARPSIRAHIYFYIYAIRCSHSDCHSVGNVLMCMKMARELGRLSGHPHGLIGS